MGQPEVIDTTWEKECEDILRPSESPPLPNFQTSGLGLVPKHDGGWQIIISAPYHSINHFINSYDYSLSYCSIDKAYDFLSIILLSKIYLKDAFRLILICGN